MGLSKEDIDKLAGDKGTPPEAAADNADAIRSKYREAFREHLENIFSTLTGEGFSVGQADEESSKGAELATKLGGEWLGFSGALDVGKPLATVHLIPVSMAKFIAGKIMGQEMPETLEDSHIGALREATNNLLGAWATAMGEMLSVEAKTSAEMKALEGEGAAAAGTVEGIKGQDVLCWKCAIKAGDTEDVYTVVIPSKQMADLVKANPEFKVSEEKTMPQDSPSGPGAPMKTKAEVEKAVFQEFEGTAPVGESSQIELLLDVPLTVSVELGRKRLSIKEILDLTPGSLLELDKLAGEPVDLMVNGKLFARGEVVVIDENFGVRISSIVSPKERLERLK